MTRVATIRIVRSPNLHLLRKKIKNKKKKNERKRKNTNQNEKKNLTTERTEDKCNRNLLIQKFVVSAE